MTDFEDVPLKEVLTALSPDAFETGRNETGLPLY